MQLRMIYTVNLVLFPSLLVGCSSSYKAENEKLKRELTSAKAEIARMKKSLEDLPLISKRPERINEKLLPAEKPEKRPEKPPIPPEALVFLNLNEKGQLLIPGVEPTKEEEKIKRYLQTEFNHLQRTALGERKQISPALVIRAQKDLSLRYGELVQLMNLCKQAGFSKIHCVISKRKKN